MTLKPWRDWPLAQKGLVALALPLALFMWALSSLFWLEKASADAEEEARRTLSVQVNIQSVHAQIAEAATGIRGYLLTGREDFLLRYHEVRRQLPVTLSQLDLLIRDPLQRERLLYIQPRVQAKLEGLEQMRLTGRTLPPQQLLTEMVAQKKLFDEIRLTIDSLQTREQELIDLNTTRARTARERTLWLSALAGLTGFFTAFMAMWLFTSTIIRRVQRLRNHALQLARGNATLGAEQSRDELGQLSNSLKDASQLLQKRADAARIAQQQAERASNAKSSFLSRTSHELRTPLNAIVGFADVLGQSTDPGTRRAADEIATGGRHLKALIDELLDLARIEAGGVEILQMQAVPLPNVITEACGLCSHSAATLTVNCPPDAVAHADRQRLRQILLNLLSNAFKYAPAHSLVELEAIRTAGGYWRLEVRDRGPGIPESMRHRLFTPFDRLGAERTNIPGAGLGLALSLRLAEGMGGRLGNELRPGGGSVFWCEVPVHEEGTAPAPAAEPAAAGLEGPQAIDKRYRVLCADGNAGNRALLKALLQRRGDLETHFVNTGNDALKDAARLAPDAIFLELQLADGEAISLIPILRSLKSHPSIVVVTADTQPATRQRLLDAGATEVLTRPLDIPSFQQVLDRLLP